VKHPTIMLADIARLWNWWRRCVDIAVLWPAISSEPDRQLAEMAFRVHMEMDPAYDDLDEAQKQKFLEELP
jgi:hypothetical protein